MTKKVGGYQGLWWLEKGTGTVEVSTEELGGKEKTMIEKPPDVVQVGIAQAEQLAIMSAIADVVAEAFILADSFTKFADGDPVYPVVKKLCDAVTGLRATGWRPELVVKKTKRRDTHHGN